MKHAAIPLVCDAKAGLEELSTPARRLVRHAARSGAEGGLGGGGRCRHRAARRRQCPANRRAGDRRGAAFARQRCRRGLRGGRPAGRVAQAVAGLAAGRLPRGIRLLVHGLRDRRRARGQDGPAGARGRGHGRRRQLHDAELRACDQRDAGPARSSWWCSTTTATAASTGCRMATGGESFNNLFAEMRARSDRRRSTLPPIWRRWAPRPRRLARWPSLGDAMARARACERSYGIVIETDPAAATGAGGHWWDVAVPEVSDRPQVRAASRGLREPRWPGSGASTEHVRG